MAYTVNMVYTIDMVHTIQTVVHCLNISMYAYIYIARKGYNAIGVGRGAMSKMWTGWSG